MRKFILYSLIFLASCQRDSLITPTSPFVGEYKMIQYIIDHDTLVSINDGIDKWDYKDLTIQVSQGSTDSTFNFVYTCYNKQSFTKSEIQYPESTIDNKGDRYQILNYFNTMDIDGGYIKADTLYSKAIAVNEETLNPLQTTIIAVKAK